MYTPGPPAQGWYRPQCAGLSSISSQDNAPQACLWPICWRHFLSEIPFPDDSSLCQVGRTLSSMLLIDPACTHRSPCSHLHWSLFVSLSVSVCLSLSLSHPHTEPLPGSCFSIPSLLLFLCGVCWCVKHLICGNPLECRHFEIKDPSTSCFVCITLKADWSQTEGAHSWLHPRVIDSQQILIKIELQPAKVTLQI